MSILSQVSLLVILYLLDESHMNSERHHFVFVTQTGYTVAIEYPVKAPRNFCAILMDSSVGVYGVGVIRMSVYFSTNYYPISLKL